MPHHRLSLVKPGLGFGAPFSRILRVSRFILVGWGLERETGFEPAALCLEGRCSTTELPPHNPHSTPPYSWLSVSRSHFFLGHCDVLSGILSLPKGVSRSKRSAA